jgi:hypothetical protein
MNEQLVRKNIRKILFEDNWVGSATDDKSAGIFDVDKEDSPIDPEPQMATQLTVSEPPVQDENYIPKSTADLSNALKALFSDTPEDQVEYVYRQAHRLRSYAEEKSKIFRVAEPTIDDTIPLDKPVRKSTKIPEKFKKSEE